MSQLLSERRFNKMKMQKKGGIVGDLISGVGGLIITTVLILVVISTLLGANLLTGTYATTAGNMSSNFTTGIDSVSAKIPTILLIGAVVLLFGVLVLLVARAKAMAMGGSGSL